MRFDFNLYISFKEYLNYKSKRLIFEEMKHQKIVYATFCFHNYQKSLTNQINLKCLNDQNLVHVVSQVGKICNKCSQLLTRSIQTGDNCLVCTEQIEQYLKQKQICPHNDQQFDQAQIKCRNDPKEIHYVPLKTKVCKICLNKINAAFNISDDCKVCSGNQNIILEDIQKNIVSPIFSSIKNIVRYLTEQKAEDSVFKNELEHYCRAQKRPQVKTQVPSQLIHQESSQNHLSNRYSLYPKCPKHRNSPIQLCNKCLVAVLNLDCCPYGCPYVKQSKQKQKAAQNTKISQTGFLCMYPHSLQDSYYLDLFIIRQIEEKGRLDRWESTLRKVRPLDSITSKFQKYFSLYAGSAYIGNKLYLNCGGIIGGSIATKQASNHSFLLRLTDDYKNLEIRQTQFMKCKRASHAVAFHQDTQRVYAIGGYIKEQGCLKTCQYYDINSNQWVQMGELNVERSKPTAFIYQNQLYVFGGMTTNPKINQSFGQRYVQSKKRWEPLAFEGFEYPSLTGSVSLTTLPIYQNKEALWMVGGSNYQDYSTMIQKIEINKSSFSLNVDNYLTTNRARCNATIGLINEDIVVVFGGLKEHESITYIQAIKIRTIKDFVQPMFAYENIQLGSYKLMLRQSSDNVYTKLYENLEEEDIVNKQKLDKNDIKLTSNYNSHMLEKMFYAIGKNFVWVPIQTKK